MSMEFTRENVIKSLRSCSKTSKPVCDCCLYKELGGECVGQLKLDAAAMLEEIGKGELPRKPATAEKENPTVRYCRAMGRADLLAHAVGYSFTPPYDFCPETDEEREEEIIYFEAISDAAITVLELRAKENTHG